MYIKSHGLSWLNDLFNKQIKVRSTRFSGRHEQELRPESGRPNQVLS